jgi:hypothetical protein
MRDTTAFSRPYPSASHRPCHLELNGMNTDFFLSALFPPFNENDLRTRLMSFSGGLGVR